MSDEKYYRCKHCGEWRRNVIPADPEREALWLEYAKMLHGCGLESPPASMIRYHELRAALGLEEK